MLFGRARSEKRKASSSLTASFPAAEPVEREPVGLAHRHGAGHPLRQGAAGAVSTSW